MPDIKKLDILLPKALDIPSISGNNSSSQQVDGESFSEILKNALGGVNQAQADGDVATDKMLRGEDVDIHDTMAALKKADTSLKLMLEVRNKLLEAYQEVIKTQI